MTSAPQSPNSILILGPTGTLGTAVLRGLATHPSLRPAHLTLLARPGRTKQDLSAQLGAELKPLLSGAGEGGNEGDEREDAGCEKGAGASKDADGGFDVVHADLGSAGAEDLAAVVGAAGCEVVVCCAGFGFGGQDVQERVVRGAGEAGCVRRIVAWQFGIDYDEVARSGGGEARGLFAGQVGVRRVLRGGAEGERGGELTWTIVSTGMFMSFLFEEAFGVVQGLRWGRERRGEAEAEAEAEGEAEERPGEEERQEGGEVVVRALGSWTNRVTLTAVEDIGRIVADVLANPPPDNDSGGSIVYTAGQTPTYGQIADVVERVLGKKVRREEWSVEFLREELRKDPEDQMKKYRVAFAEGVGCSWEVERTVNWERGIGTRNLEDWLRKELGK